MAKEEALRLIAKVVEALPSATFKCQLVDNDTHFILAHLSGRLRQNFIRVLPGDLVTLEVSPYDLLKGRIVYRGVQDGL